MPLSWTMMPLESEQATTLAPSCVELFDRVDGDVAGAGDDAGLAFERVLADLEHLAHEEDGAVPGRLRAHERAAPADAFAGEHAGFVPVGDALVLPEQEAELAAADADIARRNVGVLAEMAIELGHEALAEAHDFVVRLALRVEVRAAFAAADGHARERVLEELFEAQELDDAEIAPTDESAGRPCTARWRC